MYKRVTYVEHKLCYKTRIFELYHEFCKNNIIILKCTRSYLFFKRMDFEVFLNAFVQTSKKH